MDPAFGLSARAQAPLAGAELPPEGPAPCEPWEVGYALVKCGATWCGPCHRIAPTFRAFAAQGKINCYEVDIDAEPSFAERFAVASLPTFLLLLDKRELGRVEGADWARVEQLLAAHYTTGLP